MRRRWRVIRIWYRAFLTFKVVLRISSFITSVAASIFELYATSSTVLELIVFLFFVFVGVLRELFVVIFSRRSKYRLTIISTTSGESNNESHWISWPPAWIAYPIARNIVDRCIWELSLPIGPSRSVLHWASGLNKAPNTDAPCTPKVSLWFSRSRSRTSIRSHMIPNSRKRKPLTWEDAHNIIEAEMLCARRTITLRPPKKFRIPAVRRSLSFFDKGTVLKISDGNCLTVPPRPLTELSTFDLISFSSRLISANSLWKLWITLTFSFKEVICFANETCKLFNLSLTDSLSLHR